MSQTQYKKCKPKELNEESLPEIFQKKKAAVAVGTLDESVINNSSGAVS